MATGPRPSQYTRALVRDSDEMSEGDDEANGYERSLCGRGDTMDGYGSIATSHIGSVNGHYGVGDEGNGMFNGLAELEIDCDSPDYDGTLYGDLYESLNVDLPDFDLPDRDLPDRDLPDLDLPDLDLPELDLPNLDIPDLDIPDLDIPDLDIPDLDIPDLVISDLRISDSGGLPEHYTSRSEGSGDSSPYGSKAGDKDSSVGCTAKNGVAASAALLPLAATHAEVTVESSRLVAAIRDFTPLNLTTSPLGIAGNAPDFDAKDITTQLAAVQPNSKPLDETTTTTVQPRSALQRLPTELRLHIYDYLLEPMLELPEHLDTYMVPSEWPKLDLNTYTSMLLTCKDLRQEWKPYFEKHFLPKLMLYFDSVTDLLDFQSKVRKLGQSYHTLRICLSSCTHTAGYYTTWDVDPCKPFARPAATTGVEVCISEQLFDPAGFRDSTFYKEAICEPHDLCLRRVARARRDNPDTQCYHGFERQGKWLDVVRSHHPGWAQRISIHQVCGHPHTRYMLMIAKIDCMEWDYDPYDTYPKTRLQGSAESVGRMLETSSTQIEEAKYQELRQAHLE
ncbi:hypothetical protein LTR85_009573 [Meristemomyces frigidus]|nr:hypothetical protein LTR85_009573 [Meristemomyces frigidus]